MADDRLSVAELRDHLSSLHDPAEVEALMEGEDRPTAVQAINSRLRELRQPESSDTYYERAALLAGASAFGTTEAGMAGALALAGLEEGATREQAQNAVDEWRSREV